MIALYRLLWRLVLPLMRLAKSFHPRLREAVAVRKTNLANLITWRRQNTKPVVWMHCASLGEYDQGLPVFQALRQAHKDKHFVLTFFSPSGFNHIDRESAADWVGYLPWDHPSTMAAFISELNPSLSLFVKNEVWPNCFLELGKLKNQRLVMLSAIFREGQAYFGSFSSLYSRPMEVVDHFFVQNLRSSELLEGLGFSNVSVVGDTRYDRVKQRMEHLKSFEALRGALVEKPVLIVGSSWPEEEEAAVAAWKRTVAKFHLILAPHDVSEVHLQQIEQLAEGSVCRLSQLQRFSVQDLERKVVLVDSIGQLSHLYQLANLAVIGGAFGSGLHNILEALVQGVPVIFGPKTSRFPEAAMAIEAGCAEQVPDQRTLETTIMRYFEDPEMISVKEASALTFVESQLGATDKILKNGKSLGLW